MSFIAKEAYTNKEFILLKGASSAEKVQTYLRIKAIKQNITQ